MCTDADANKKGQCSGVVQVQDVPFGAAIFTETNSEHTSNNKCTENFETVSIDNYVCTEPNMSHSKKKRSPTVLK